MLVGLVTSANICTLNETDLAPFYLLIPYMNRISGLIFQSMYIVVFFFITKSALSRDTIITIFAGNLFFLILN